MRTANIKDFVYGNLCESLCLLDADNLKYKPRFKYLKFLAVTYWNVYEFVQKLQE